MAKGVQVCEHCGIAIVGGENAMSTHIEVKHGRTCPVCEKRPITTESCVDVYSDTPIECCESCAHFLSQAMRYQFTHTATRSWMHENKPYLDRAINELHRVYEMRYANNGKRKATASDGSESEAG